MLRIYSFSGLAYRCSKILSAGTRNQNVLRSMVTSPDTKADSDTEMVTVTFVRKDGSKVTTDGKIGENVLYLAKRFDVEVEGACEASLACTTCHVYVDEEYLDTFPPATETEEDLLDSAPFLKDTSRLACQLILAKEHNGITLKLPQATRNFYVDGHKPSHH